MVRSIGFALLAAIPLALGTPAQAEPAAPAEIKIGELYASSGPYASISMPVYDGMKLWVSEQNAAGGIFVKPYNKKIPIKLISYDDQSSTATAATLYNQLITQDKVDLLVADSGSVLTSVAVPIAKEHKMFLFDLSGTGGTFFTKDNPYIALVCSPASTVWPKYLGEFLNNEGPKLALKRLAILYSTNDFTSTQATTIRGYIKSAGNLDIVYDQGVPTSTSNYTVLINNIAAAKPDAVLQLGYVGNDIAFLRDVQASGLKFRFLFTLYSGIERDEVLNNVGPDAMTGVFTYVTSANYAYQPNFGPTGEEFHKVWDKAYPPGSGVAWGANAIIGYGGGLVIQRTLETTAGMSQLDIHDAVFGLSGKLVTLNGPFELNEEGGQIGTITPLGQLQPDGKGGVDLVTVYPPRFAHGTAIVAPQ